ncbi:CDHR4 isoform 5 [Pongo abelii]|uniref:CDHR4 isoform 5 n=1 Tax=Pongo abelii TaxID=9601 RepID=A0A2J8TGZ7_PONAB|nr:CDHR4 isoform 5 [Pongo abelii]
MVLLRLLVFLFAPVVSDLCSLPCFINVSESQGPGTILQFLSFNCSSYTPTPTLELLNVQPPTTFFNPPSLARWRGTYVGKLTLSSSARLDALMVNHYKLQLKFTCGNHVTEGSLSVDVQRDLSHLQCAGQFASPGEARGSRQGGGRHGLNRSSLTSTLASWGNDSGSRDSHTWGSAVHSAPPRPRTPRSAGKPRTWDGG